MGCDICTCNARLSASYWSLWSQSLERAKTPLLVLLALFSTGAAIYFWHELTKTKDTLRVLRDEYRKIRLLNCELKGELDEFKTGTGNVNVEMMRTQQMSKKMCSALRNLTVMEREASVEVERLKEEVSCLKEQLCETTKDRDCLQQRLMRTARSRSPSPQRRRVVLPVKGMRETASDTETDESSDWWGSLQARTPAACSTPYARLNSETDYSYPYPHQR